ncbi:MAG TPA: dihydrodipicolinate synthase family protein, partial [Gemmatimonadaceae bacterium]|nr:dihydrodipicolinate synthase family protein [Gemmatimonadaceae bacterium]
MSGHRQLAGIFGPVVTTFRDDESLDLDAFAANARALLAAGLDGLVVTGSTGEAALVDDEERVRLVALARQLVPSERWLVAGTGAESARQCVRRCRAAGAEGADLALVVAPHYYSGAMSADALRAHYLRVADESPIPIALYNIPKYMHFHIPPTLVAELAGHGNVVGIKDSSGDAALLAGYLEAASDDFTVLTGSAPGLLAALRAGARGGILAAALFAPSLALEVRDAVRAGDDEGAEAAQGRFVLLGREVVGALGVPGVKAA